MKSFPEILIFRTKDSFFDLQGNYIVLVVLFYSQKGVLSGVPFFFSGVPFFKN
jgi:hypothetical protein